MIPLACVGLPLRAILNSVINKWHRHLYLQFALLVYVFLPRGRLLFRFRKHIQASRSGLRVVRSDSRNDLEVSRGLRRPVVKTRETHLPISLDRDVVWIQRIPLNRVWSRVKVFPSMQCQSHQSAPRRQKNLCALTSRHPIKRILTVRLS